MKVFLIGESAKHRETLLANLAPDIEVIGLPREAATSGEYDHHIGREDVLVSLRFARQRDHAPTFRLLHVPGAGLDGIDFASLPDTAAVCNVYEHEIPMAEYVMAAMLDHEIGYTRLTTDFSGERWPDLYRARVPHGEINGKTVGIIGYGRIGREVAKRAQAFGMRVLAATRSAISAGVEYVDETFRISDIGRLLGESDYVLVACPLSADTRGLIDAKVFSKMRRQAILINVSRAEIVDQKALYDALASAQIGGAVLDVWWHYPMTDIDRPAPADHPFDRLPNVRGTAHSSAWTRQLPQRRYRAIAQNLHRLQAGQPLHNVVHQPRHL